VGELIRLGGNILLDEVVLSVVVEDQVDLLGGGTANVRAEHDAERELTSRHTPTVKEYLLVFRVTVEFLLVDSAGEDLDVSTSAVNVLLVLHGVLENQILTLVAELGEFGSVGVEAGILGGLDTCA
jgi:hypothetical protein